MLGCPSTPHGYGLIDTPGLTIVYGLPELADDAVFVDALAEAEDLEEAPGTVEAVLAAGEAGRGQLRGQDAVLRGAADVQRLRHRAEVDADAGAQAGRNRRACARWPSRRARAASPSAAAAPNVPIVPDEWKPFL